MKKLTFILLLMIGVLGGGCSKVIEDRKIVSKYKIDENAKSYFIPYTNALYIYKEKNTGVLDSFLIDKLLLGIFETGTEFYTYRTHLGGIYFGLDLKAVTDRYLKESGIKTTLTLLSENSSYGMCGFDTANKFTFLPNRYYSKSDSIEILNTYGIYKNVIRYNSGSAIDFYYVKNFGLVSLKTSNLRANWELLTIKQK